MNRRDIGVAVLNGLVSGGLAFWLASWWGIVVAFLAAMYFSALYKDYIKLLNNVPNLGITYNEERVVLVMVVSVVLGIVGYFIGVWNGVPNNAMAGLASMGATFIFYGLAIKYLVVRR